MEFKRDQYDMCRLMKKPLMSEAEIAEFLAKHLESVQLVDRNPTDGISARYIVDPIWKGVDRSHSGGWGTNNKKLAERMQRAVQSGKIFLNLEIKTDVNGNTYISDLDDIDWKRANKSLLRYGF